MKSRPITIADGTTNDGTSTPGKRTLFRIALVVALVGIVAVSTILTLHGSLALARLRYFVDIGLHPLHVTSVVIILLGILSLLSFILLTIGIIKINQSFVIIAAGLLAICSLNLITFSVWSFLTKTGGEIPNSIRNAILKELNQTQYSISTSNMIRIDNTAKMARLEKQHRCCGLTDPIEDYRARLPTVFGSFNPPSSSSSTNGASGNRGKTSSTQRNTVAHASQILLPISCCNEKYRSPDDLCVDMFANNTNPIHRYNTNGCYTIIARHKYARIHKEGLMTIVAACLAVISCIALAAVARLLNEGYQIIPLRTGL